ncbi:MAG: SRPBCC family protein [Actinomycetes bacterium]
MRLNLHADGEAAIALVWDRCLYPQQWSQWAPQIRRVDCEAETLDVGVTGTVYGVVPNLGATFEVLEFDPSNHRWLWDVVAGPVKMRLEHSSVERIGGGSSTTLTADGPVGAVLTYAPVARISLESLVRPTKLT